MRGATMALVIVLLACGKQTVRPPEGDAALVPSASASATFAYPPRYMLLPPLEDDARPIATGQYRGSFVVSVGTMHSREHTSHARTAVRAQLRLEGDRAELCLDTDRSTSSSRSPYIQPRLPNGERPPWKDTSDKSQARGGFAGGIVRSASTIDLALHSEPSVCGDAGARMPSLTRADASLRCVHAKRVDGKDGAKDLLACQWLADAPYAGPGLSLPTARPDEAGAASPNPREESARETWILLALDANIEATSNETWTTPKSTLELR